MSLTPPTLSQAKRSSRPRRQSALPTALTIVCAALIEAIHGHECSGDGCLLCLVAAWTRMLMCLCVGLTVARPAIRVLRHVRTARTWRVPRRTVRSRGILMLEPELPSPTPLSMGVMLRI